MQLKENNANGERSSLAKMSEAQVKEVIEKHMLGYKSSTLALDYPITLGSIRDIIRYKTWKHVPRPAPMKGYSNFKAKVKTHDEKFLEHIRVRLDERTKIKKSRWLNKERV